MRPSVNSGTLKDSEMSENINSTSYTPIQLKEAVISQPKMK